MRTAAVKVIIISCFSSLVQGTEHTQATSGLQCNDPAPEADAPNATGPVRAKRCATGSIEHTS